MSDDQRGSPGQCFCVLAAAAALAAASGLHLYWAAGGRHGSATVIPERDAEPTMRPTRAQTIAVAGLIGAASVLYAGAATGRRPAWLFRLGAGTAGTVLVARAIGDGRTIGLTKSIKGTPFARLDTKVLSPLCAALGLAGLAAARR
jgi:hypothetical protein